MLAESHNHFSCVQSPTGLQLRHCAKRQKNGTIHPNSLFDLILIRLFFKCTLPAGGGYFGYANMPQIPTDLHTDGCGRGGVGGGGGVVRSTH